MSTNPNQTTPSWVGWLQFAGAVAGLIASLFQSQTAPAAVTPATIDNHVNNIKTGAAIIHVNNTQ